MTEKIDFLGGMTPTYREEFEQRRRYKELITGMNLIDIWFDNYCYGFINSSSEPVILAESSAIIKNFNGFADSVGAVNFVTDAFTAFRDDYVNKVENSTINYPPFLDNLVPVKGYESFESLFANWSAYSATKYASFLEDNKNIDGYESFLTEIKKVFVDQLRRFPITKSGFCLSRHNEIGASGLSVELAKLDYNIDYQKGEIIQSPDFKCYADYAAAYGFYVDKNAPWRLLCNLEHETTRLYIRNLDPNTGGLGGDPRHRHLTTEQIFDNIYRVKTHFDDLFVLQDFVTKIYNQIKKDVPFYNKSVYNANRNKVETKSIFRKEIEFLAPHQWIDLLVMVRLLEIGHYTEETYREMCTKAVRILEVYGLRRAQGTIGSDIALMLKSKLSIDKDDKSKTTKTTNPSVPGYRR